MTKSTVNNDPLQEFFASMPDHQKRDIRDWVQSMVSAGYNFYRRPGLDHLTGMDKFAITKVPESVDNSEDILAHL